MMQPTPPKPATEKQLAYLRNLAVQKGASFTVPTSSAEASAEIDRLKALRNVQFQGYIGGRRSRAGQSRTRVTRIVR
jgi:Protein of unknown function (DUF3072)